MKLEMTINGEAVTVDVPPATRLLDVLRESVGLTGTKEGCGEGECGACTIRLDGRIVNSCLIPAFQASGADLLTVEGLGSDHGLHPLQELFLTEGGAQCGICTPGMLISCWDLLERNSDPSNDDIRVAIAGNLCRCTGYEKILDSVQAAAAALRKSS